MDWARVVRGSRSSGKATTPASRMAWARAGSASGCRPPTRTAPRFIRAIRTGEGACTQSTTSAPSRTSPSASSAPASA